MVTRRKFSKMVGEIIIAGILSPLEVLAIEGRNKILVDGYVHNISNDPLSDSFYKDEKGGLWVPIYDKVGDFYSNHFDIQVKLQSGIEVDKEKPDSGHIAVEYTTMDELLKNPREVLYAFGGQELMDELEAEIKSAQKAEGGDYKTAEVAIFATLKQIVNQAFSGEGGFGSKISHRAWVFPSETYNKAGNDEVLVNAYAFSVVHEVGHALGLEHPIMEGFFAEYGRLNFMNPLPELIDVFSFNFDIHPKQIRQIKKYLRTG
ncbi:hypothetical protein KY358_02815 [Candidatus Woesearchaeota archaeon]|nr:hypothetical protein [Candidatus Woesearchaeota archaeon]